MANEKQSRQGLLTGRDIRAVLLGGEVDSWVRQSITSQLTDNPQSPLNEILFLFDQVVAFRSYDAERELAERFAKTFPRFARIQGIIRQRVQDGTICEEHAKEILATFPDTGQQSRILNDPTEVAECLTAILDSIRRFAPVVELDVRAEVFSHQPQAVGSARIQR